MPKRKTQEEFIEQANKIHNFKYNYSLVDYKGTHINVIIICPFHGEFPQTPVNHTHNHGCPTCGKKIQISKRALGLNTFIERANNKHDFKYNYSLVEYKNTKTDVKILCPIHGIFEQTPYWHLSGEGCQKCEMETRFKTTEEFISQAIKIHGSRYDYSLVDYTRNTEKIIIICRIHGKFKQTAHIHIHGFGCQKCGKTARKTLDKFISQANDVHKFKYDYSKISEYKNNRTEVEIICSVHGSFYQTPHIHLRGCGCTECSNIMSNISQKWLDYHNISEENREYKIKLPEYKNKLSVDGYDPITNTIYEFYGDFWHGNPTIYNPNNINPTTTKTYGELYNETMLRESYLKQAGYNVISIWESNWLSKNK